LKDSSFELLFFGCGVGLASFDVLCREFDDRGRYVSLMYFVDEVMYFYCVKCFAEVYGDYYGVIKWRFFVEAQSDLVG
jgi:hypothetical protein